MNKRHYRQNGAGALALSIAAGGGSADSIKGDGSAASIEGGGRAASIEGADAPYEDWLRQCFYPLPVPSKKRTSHERFVNTSGVRSENRRFPIWRNDFGDKNGVQAKQRGEAY